MDRKKKILFYLIGLWILIFIIIQYNGNMAEKKETKVLTQKSINQISIGNDKVAIQKKYSYPELTLKITNPELFGELLRPDLEQKKQEAERKKVVTIQAPPLPPLPLEPKPKTQDKEPAIDELKDITLMGILKKDNKNIAFFKKDRDIKSFRIGDKIFNTNFVISRIEGVEVILTDEKGSTRILSVEKEVKDAKDKKK